MHREFAIIESHTGYDFIGDLPKVKAWQGGLLATGLAEKSVARDFEQAFTDFYLSDDTFLGRDQRDVTDKFEPRRTTVCC